MPRIFRINVRSTGIRARWWHSGPRPSGLATERHLESARKAPKEAAPTFMHRNLCASWRLPLAVWFAVGRTPWMATACLSNCCRVAAAGCSGKLLVVLGSVGRRRPVHDLAEQVAERAALVLVRRDGRRGRKAQILPLPPVKSRPRGQAGAVRIARLGKIRPVGLHDRGEIAVGALKIAALAARRPQVAKHVGQIAGVPDPGTRWNRSEEHTSELQSLRHLVCRLLLEKKKNSKYQINNASSLFTPYTTSPSPHID